MKAPRQNARRRGTVAILFAAALPIVLGMLGLALEFSMAFQRQGQLQQMADAAALAAAQQLNGTASGIMAAYLRASSAALGHQVRGASLVLFPSEALSFSSDRSGGWVSFAAAQAAPAGLRFVKADMAALGEEFTSMPSIFGTLLGDERATTLGAQAVAGPNAVRILPLAICAPSSVPQATRVNGGGADEIVQYGLRQGVGYNLLALNPAAGASSGEYFLVDPLNPPGSTASSASTLDAAVAPFMCTGKLAYPALTGALHLRRNGSFGLWSQLNSRFGDYVGGNGCDAFSAPPDTNVREYRGTAANWMNSAPPQAAAASSTPAAGKPLTTIADPAPPLPAVAPAQYGTLWAYGIAKSSTNSPLTTTKWNWLYPASPALSASGWPSGGPYSQPAYSTAPAIVGRKERRLLYVPLLACPIAAGSEVDGNVLAVARFLLTARASASAVPAEFAGILTAAELAALASDMELLQ